MEVVSLLLFIGAVWVTGALGLFAWNLLVSGHEHEDRLAILPLEDNWQDPQATAREPRVPHQEGKAESR